MGFSKKAQVDSGFEPDGSTKKWVITGISIRTTLKPVNTRPKGKENTRYGEEEEEEEEEEAEQFRSTTPTAKECRIPEKLPCPPAPRKQRPNRCNHGVVREFFAPPELEAFFKCYVEKAI